MATVSKNYSVLPGHVCSERYRELIEKNGNHLFETGGHNLSIFAREPLKEPSASSSTGWSVVDHFVEHFCATMPVPSLAKNAYTESAKDTKPISLFGSWLRGINEHPLLNFSSAPAFSGAPALSIDKEGMVVNKRVINERRKTIENGKMNSVKGIIVHQTGGATAQSALDSYKKLHADGAHFLIDKDGTIYQTASIKQRTAHVGKLHSRCVFELKCPKPKYNPTKEHRAEMKKSVPDRYPANEDSIGIELVGQAFPLGNNVRNEDKKYEKVTDAQNDSLEWLIGGLWSALQLPHSEVFSHDQVSWRTGHEGASARIFQAPQNSQK